jgi:hypothetical protein
LETVEPKKYNGNEVITALDKIGGVATLISSPGIKKAVAPTMKVLCSIAGTGSQIFSSGDLAVAKTAHDNCAAQTQNIEALVDTVQKGAAVVIKGAKIAGDFFKTEIAQKAVHNIKHGVSTAWSWFKDAFKPNKPASANVAKAVTAVMTKKVTDAFGVLETIDSGGVLGSSLSATYAIAVNAVLRKALLRISYVVGSDTKRVLALEMSEQPDTGRDTCYTRSYKIWDEVWKFDTEWVKLGYYSGSQVVPYGDWNIYKIGEIHGAFNDIWSVAHAMSHCDDKPTDVPKLLIAFDDIVKLINDSVAPEWWDAGCSVSALKNNLNQAYNHGSAFNGVAISPSVDDSNLGTTSTAAATSQANAVADLATHKAELIAYLDSV